MRRNVVFRFAVLLTVAFLQASLFAQPPAQPKEEEIKVTGIVVLEGKPADGITVTGSRPYSKLTRSATSDSTGEFSLLMPMEINGGFRLVAQTADGSFMGVYQFRGSTKDQPAKRDEPVKIELKPAQRVEIKVNDHQGKAIEAANVGMVVDHQLFARHKSDAAGRVVTHLPSELLLQTIYAWKPATGFDYRHFYDPQKARNKEPQDPVDLSKRIEMTLSAPRTVRIHVVEADSGKPIPQMNLDPWLFQKPSEPDQFNASYAQDEFDTATNDEGYAVFDWLPTWDANRQLTIWPTTKEYHRQRGTYEYAKGDGTLTMKLTKLVPMRGRVTFPDGRPAAGAAIVVAGDSYSVFDDFRAATKTDENGNYEVKIAPNYLYFVRASWGTERPQEKQSREPWASVARDGFVAAPSTPMENVNFTLRPATRIFGRVTQGSDHQPVAGQYVTLYQRGKDLHNLKDVTLPNPEKSQKYVQPMLGSHIQTDADGRYEFFVGPGSFDVRGPTQTNIEKFEISDETSREVNFHAVRAEKGMLAGRVTNESGRPVAGARIEGIYRNDQAGRDLSTVTDAEGRFNVSRELHRMVLHAFTPDKQLGGVVEIEPDASTATVVTYPYASAVGRVLDGETKNPLLNRELVYGVNVHLGEDKNSAFRTSFGGKVQTDADGRFKITGLLLNQPYQLSITQEGGNSWRNVGSITPKTATETDLKDLMLAAEYKPPTLDERITSSFRKPLSAEERYATSLRDTQLGHLQLLIVFADPAAAVTRSLYQLRFEDRDVRHALDNYSLLSLPTTAESAAATSALTKRLGLILEADSLPLIVIRSAEDQPLGEATIQEISTDGKVDKAKLISLLNRYATGTLDAQQLLDEALQRAKTENKRVFVQETATWCGPCWMLSRFWDKHRAIFDKDYLVVKVDHRWENHEQVMNGLHDKPGGIPWFAILDPQGKVLANSDSPAGNIGYPSDAPGIDHFISMLEKTRIKLTDADLSAIRAALEEANKTP